MAACTRWPEMKHHVDFYMAAYRVFPGSNPCSVTAVDHCGRYTPTSYVHVAVLGLRQTLTVRKDDRGNRRTKSF